MRRRTALKYSLAALAALLLLWLALGRYIHVFGASAELARYLPEADCAYARFALTDDQRGVRGNGFVSIAIYSDRCVQSIRRALKARGSRETYVAENLTGWNIPGRNRLVGDRATTFQGPLLNLFTFRDNGSILWQRYSE